MRLLGTLLPPLLHLAVPLLVRGLAVVRPLPLASGGEPLVALWAAALPSVLLLLTTQVAQKSARHMPSLLSSGLLAAASATWAPTGLAGIRAITLLALWQDGHPPLGHLRPFEMGQD